MKNTNKLLIDSNPIQVLPELAEQIGLNKAIFLQQLHYWLGNDCAKLINDKYWVFNSYKNWKEDNFPFWSEATIKRIIQALEEDGLIITDDYNSYAIDKTKWYTIDYEKLKPYEEKSIELKKRKQLKKQAKKEEREQRKITRKTMEFKKILLEKNNSSKASKIASGQNDQTDKQRITADDSKSLQPSKIAWGQNDPSIGSNCTNHKVKMTQPIPETTKEITSEIKNNNNKYTQSRYKNNTIRIKNQKDVVVENINKNIDKKEIEKIKQKLETISKKELDINYIMDLIDRFYTCNILSVINKFDEIRPLGEIRSFEGFIFKAVEKEFKNKGWTKNTALEALEQNNSTNTGKPEQATNFEQRQYDDEFFEGLYDNY